MTVGYWQDAAADAAMQEDHEFVWEAMLQTIDVDLTGKRVLDSGCNRGGFLRLMADRSAIGEGFGYDPASGAVEDARRLAGGRPLSFSVADTVPAGWQNFDVAFSHEVLYLLHDLAGHARAIFDALTPGGVYYAVMGVHADAPLMAQWHHASRQQLNLPDLYGIDDVLAAFERAGFEAAAGRLRIGFVPNGGHGRDGPERMLDRLAYYCEQKLMLRFVRGG